MTGIPLKWRQHDDMCRIYIAHVPDKTEALQEAHVGIYQLRAQLKGAKTNDTKTHQVHDL